MTPSPLLAALLALFLFASVSVSGGSCTTSTCWWSVSYGSCQLSNSTATCGWGMRSFANSPRCMDANGQRSGDDCRLAGITDPTWLSCDDYHCLSWLAPDWSDVPCSQKCQVLGTQTREVVCHDSTAQTNVSSSVCVNRGMEMPNATQSCFIANCSTDNTLRLIELRAKPGDPPMTLSPSFNPTGTGFAASIEVGLGTTIRFIKNNTYQTIVVTGSGSTFALSPDNKITINGTAGGSTSLQVQVTPASGTVRTYYLSLTWLPSTNRFLDRIDWTYSAQPPARDSYNNYANEFWSLISPVTGRFNASYLIDVSGASPQAARNQPWYFTNSFAYQIVVPWDVPSIEPYFVPQSSAATIFPTSFSTGTLEQEGTAQSYTITIVAASGGQTSHYTFSVVRTAPPFLTMSVQYYNEGTWTGAEPTYSADVHSGYILTVSGSVSGVSLSASTNPRYLNPPFNAQVGYLVGSYLSSVNNNWNNDGYSPLVGGGAAIPIALGLNYIKVFAQSPQCTGNSSCFQFQTESYIYTVIRLSNLASFSTLSVYPTPVSIVPTVFNGACDPSCVPLYLTFDYSMGGASIISLRPDSDTDGFSFLFRFWRASQATNWDSFEPDVEYTQPQSQTDPLPISTDFMEVGTNYARAQLTSQDGSLTVTYEFYLIRMPPPVFSSSTGGDSALSSSSSSFLSSTSDVSSTSDAPSSSVGVNSSGAALSSTQDASSSVDSRTASSSAVASLSSSGAASSSASSSGASSSSAPSSSGSISSSAAASSSAPPSSTGDSSSGVASSSGPYSSSTPRSDRSDLVSSSSSGTSNTTASSSSSSSSSSTGTAVVPKVVTEQAAAISVISPPITVPKTVVNPCDSRPGFCLNHGQCVSTLVNQTAADTQTVQLSCVCPRAFFGPHCEVAILACTSSCASPMGGNASLQLLGVGFEYVSELMLAGMQLPFELGASLSSTSPLASAEILTKKDGGPWEDYVRTDHAFFNVITFKSLPFASLPKSASSLLHLDEGGFRLLALDVMPAVDSSTSTSNFGHTSTMLATSTFAAPSYQSLVAHAQFASASADGGGSVPIEIPYTVAPVYYAVSDCVKGQFQNSIGDCIPCPAGCECPGAGRCWPLSGYWSYSQNSIPIKCSVPENCPGTSSSGSSSAFLTTDTSTSAAFDTQRCAAGYTGAGCVACADNYYALNGRCYDCGPSTDQTGEMVSILIAAAAVTISLSAGVAFLSSVRLVYLVTVFVILQQMSATGQQGAQNVPGVVGRGLAIFFSWISVINWDLQILRPGCTVPSFTFLTLFWATWALVAVSGALFFTACLVRFFIRRMSERVGRGLTPEAQAALTRKALEASKKDLVQAAQIDSLFHTSPKEDFRRRITHACIILAALFYLKLSTLMIRMFQCTLAPNPQSPFAAVPGDQSYYLSADLQTHCYTGAHLGTLIFVSVCFVVYSLGFPLGTFIILCRAFADKNSTGVIGWLWRHFPILHAKQAKREEHKAAYKALTAEEKQRREGVGASAATTQPGVVAAKAVEDKYAVSKPTGGSGDEMVDPALTSLYIEHRRIATYAWLFLGIRNATFPYRLSAFLTNFLFAVITNLCPSSITQLFLLGLCFATDALIVCWCLPFRAWYDNARSALVALFALGHSVLMIGIQTNAIASPEFYIGLVIFVALCVALAFRTQIVNFLNRVTGSSGAVVDAKTGEIADPNAVTPFQDEDAGSDEGVDFSITGEADSARARRLGHHRSNSSSESSGSTSGVAEEREHVTAASPAFHEPAEGNALAKSLHAHASSTETEASPTAAAAHQKQLSGDEAAKASQSENGSLFEPSGELSGDDSGGNSERGPASPSAEPLRTPALQRLSPGQPLPMARRSSDSASTSAIGLARSPAAGKNPSDRSQSLQRALRALSTGEVEPMPAASVTAHVRRSSAVATGKRSPAIANAFVNRKASLSIAAAVPGASAQSLLSQLHSARAAAAAAKEAASSSRSPSVSPLVSPPLLPLDDLDGQ